MPITQGGSLAKKAVIGVRRSVLGLSCLMAFSRLFWHPEMPDSGWQLRIGPEGWIEVVSINLSVKLPAYEFANASSQSINSTQERVNACGDFLDFLAGEIRVRPCSLFGQRPDPLVE